MCRWITDTREKDSDVTWLYGPWKQQTGSPKFSPRNSNCRLWSVPHTPAFKSTISEKLPSRLQNRFMWPDRHQQSTRPDTAGGCRPSAATCHDVHANPWARGSNAAFRYTTDLPGIIMEPFFPSRDHHRRVRFNEEVQQCVVRDRSPASDRWFDTDGATIDRLWVDMIPPNVTGFPSISCGKGKVLSFCRMIALLPPTTLKSSDDITEMSWSAATNYLEKI